MNADKVHTMNTDAALTYIAGNILTCKAQRRYSDGRSIMFGSFWTIQQQLISMSYAQCSKYHVKAVENAHIPIAFPLTSNFTYINELNSAISFHRNGILSTRRLQGINQCLHRDRSAKSSFPLCFIRFYAPFCRLYL